MRLLTSQIKDTAGMERQMFADQKLCLTSGIFMGLYSNLDNVTIFALFSTGILAVKAATLNKLIIITLLGQHNLLL